MNTLTAISAKEAAGSEMGNAASTANVSTATSFSTFLQDVVGQVDRLETTAEQTTGQLLSGVGADVHQVVIAVEKANAAFEMALAIRNKAVQAYQQVMSMQF